MSRSQITRGALVVWLIVGLLAILHQDLWYWDNRTLVFGFMPIGLLYHAGFSVACAVTWALAVRFCWPTHIEAWADEVESDQGEGASS